MFSKKVFFAILFFIVLVGGTVGFKFLKTKISNNDGPLVSVAEPNPKLYEDADGDGLKDWEENLWKTDVNNSDTDNDGVNDFDEIRSGHDPLKPGPDDLLTTNDFEGKTNELIESDLTETDKFARLFFAQYIASKENNVGYQDGDYDKLVSLLDRPITESEMFKKTSTDFNIIPNTTENIKNYANELSKIIKEGQTKYGASEIVELQKLEDGQEKSFNTENIKEASERYTFMANSFSELSVPADLLANHTKIVNVLYIISSSVSAMQYYLTDPVSTVSQISLYPDSLDILNQSLEYLGSYIKSKNIKFSTSDDGYIFFGKL